MKKFCSTISLLFVLLTPLHAKDLLLRQSFEADDYTGYTTSYPFSVIGPEAFFYRAGSNQLPGVSKLSGFDGDHYLCLQNTGPALGSVVLELDEINIKDYGELELQLLMGSTTDKLGKLNPESGITFRFTLDDGSSFTHNIRLRDMENGAIQNSSLFLDELAGKHISGNALTIQIQSYAGLGQAIAIDNIMLLGSLENAVDFHEIKAMDEHRTASITWTTKKESNISHFVLEKKTENSDWTQLSNVSAKGYDLAWYQLIDPRPENGTNQYRITAVFKDGQELQSEIYDLRFEEAGAEELKIYPNPAKDHIWFEWVGGPKSAYTFRVLDAYGNPLLWSELPATRNKGNIDIGLLRDGIYILEFTKGNKVYDFRFVKK